MTMLRTIRPSKRMQASIFRKLIAKSHREAADGDYRNPERPERPRETSTKVASVPMLTSSPGVVRGSDKAKIEATMPVMITDPVRGAEARVHPRQTRREQVAPAHGEGQPALAEDHHHPRQPDEERQRVHERRRREGRLGERRGRRGRGREPFVGLEPGEHHGRQDVEAGADPERGEDADGDVLLGIVRLL